MKLRFSELFLVFLFSSFITFSICGFEPTNFLGWIDEKDSFLSWAVSHENGALLIVNLLVEQYFQKACIGLLKCSMES